MRVLLADDEPVILRGLKKLISWDELGLHIVGEAQDGYELRQLIPECSPDLIISDISMPGLSGIDIIKELHEQGRPIKVIFISAYQEFAYAQQAVQYGALDYLVKPVSKPHLESVLRRAVDMIREENEEERTKERLDHYERKHRTVTISEYLDSLMDGDQRAANELTRMGAVPLSRYTSICLIEIDDEMGGESHWAERERKLVHFALNNIMKETLDSCDNCLMFVKDGRYGILVQFEHPEEPRRLIGNLHEQITSFLKLKLSAGIGQTVSGIELADASYRSALKALQSKYFTGLNQIINAEELEQGAVTDEIPVISELQEEIIKALCSQNKKLLEEMTDRLRRGVIRQAKGNKVLAVTSMYNTVLALEQELTQFGIPSRFSRRAESSLLDRLTSHATFAGAMDELIAIIQHMFEQLNGKLANKEVAELTKVKAYIAEHFAENITLESIAAIIYMNPYYFSSFFKKHTGKNFKQVLTEERMKHAIGLLLTTDLMIYEIAEAVGYNNARHFSDMFKKLYGKLPQEYRQSARAEQGAE
ncbi:response regulator transcription factor [Paenibacillus senegalimassiliensis]|uniref:response regulator transcription factor n=1 Tax=Paenibacillus senegalimassiliensis TaxID=1737426 RepID=UPI00073E67FE|nr:response regulator [Paenibacillus senegalimassiliensis]